MRTPDRICLKFNLGPTHPFFGFSAFCCRHYSKTSFSVNEVAPGDPFQFTFLLKALEGYSNWLEDESPDLMFQDVNPSKLNSILCRGASLGFCLLRQTLNMDLPTPEFLSGFP